MNNQAPLVSILLPIFSTQYLDILLGSTVIQSYADLEIIIGDSSQDKEVPKILERWNDPRIKHIEMLSESKNPNELFAKMTTFAQGKYIKFTDENAILLPKSIESLVSILESTNAKMIFHDSCKIDQHGALIQTTNFNLKLSYFEIQASTLITEIISNNNVLIKSIANCMVETQSFKNLSFDFSISRNQLRLFSHLALAALYMHNSLTVLGCNHIGSGLRSIPLHHRLDYPIRTYEKELLARWSADLGLLSNTEYNIGSDWWGNEYKTKSTEYPEYHRLLMANKLPIKGKQHLTELYLNSIQKAYQMSTERILLKNFTQTTLST